MQFQMMCYGHTQTGKMTRYHNSGYPERCCHPARWHAFVSNRVSQIQSMLPTTEFINVPSEENPADLGSRGLLATQLVAQRKFWFQGPLWWGSSFPDQPQTLITKEEACQKVKSMTVLTSPSNSLVDLEKFNSLVKLLRALCICK